MKHAIILGILILSLFLVSCGKTTNFVCPDGKIVTDPSSCGTGNNNPIEDQVSPTTEEKSAGSSDSIPDLPMAPKVQRLIDKGLSVGSFSYDFKDLQKPKEALTYHYNIKSSLVKRYLPITTKILYQNDFDVVIFNRENKTATAYCESQEYCKKVGEYGQVNYDDYYVDTPLDWLEKIKTAELTSTSEEVFGRSTWTVKANDGEFMVWIEDYYGVPLKVQEGNLGYEFREPKFNTLSDSAVAFEERAR